jgi:hypothetical protein
VPRSFPLSPDTINDFDSLSESPKHLEQHGGRILQIGIHHTDRTAGCRADTSQNRGLVSEIPAQTHYSVRNSVIACEPLENLSGIVTGPVIDPDNLEVPHTGFFEFSDDSRRCLTDSLALVEAWNHN